MYSPARPKSFTKRRLVQAGISLAVIAAQVAVAWAIAERFGLAAGLALIAGVALGMMASRFSAGTFRKAHPGITAGVSIGFMPLRWNKTEGEGVEYHDLDLHYVSMVSAAVDEPGPLVVDEPVGIFAGSGMSTCRCYEGSIGCLGPPCVTERPELEPEIAPERLSLRSTVDGDPELIRGADGRSLPVPGRYPDPPHQRPEEEPPPLEIAEGRARLTLEPSGPGGVLSMDTEGQYEGVTIALDTAKMTAVRDWMTDRIASRSVPRQKRDDEDDL